MLKLVHQLDVELFRTETLVVWIRRPTGNHRNWWLCYYSTDEDEARAWDSVILRVSTERGFGPFHQGVWPEEDHQRLHPDCRELTPHRCPGVIQAWEMWLGCSPWGLHFHDAPLDEVIACGDPALERILEAVPAIREQADEAKARWSNWRRNVG